MKGSLDIPVGRAFSLDGSTKLVFRRVSRDHYVFEAPDRFPMTFTEPELIDFRDTNRLKDWVPPPPGHPAGVLPGPVAITYAMALPCEQQEAEWRLDYCMAWAEEEGISLSDRGLGPVIDRVHRRRKTAADDVRRYEPPPPNFKTVQAWVRRWLGRGKSVDALVSQERFKGNRRPRLSASIVNLMAEVIDEHYLSTKRLTVKATHNVLKKAVAAFNGRRPHVAAPVPSYDALARAVKSLCPYTIDFCRYGPAFARNKWRSSTHGYVTTHANQVWEIDDTRADLICVRTEVDPDTGENRDVVVGRPWITIVIDRHTRMLMAFVISFSPPDTATAMEALKIAILNKRSWLAKHGVEGEHPGEGVPDWVHVDNAAYYNTEELRRGLNLLGINLATMPVLKAWYKGTVERVIGTVMRSVFHVVPGTTHANIFERDKETTPELVAEATIDRMRHELLHWIVNDYHQRLHKGLGDKPVSEWRLSRARTRQRFMPAREDVESALSRNAIRLARKDGLQFKKLMYHSEWVHQVYLLPKAQWDRELVIRHDEADLETIHFLHPALGEWHPAYLKPEFISRARGRTLEEYEMAQAMRACRPEELNESTDPNWEDTYRQLGLKIDDLRDSHRLHDRTKAEAAREDREKLVARTKRLTTPESTEPPAPSQDLSSLVAAAANAVVKTVAAPGEPGPTEAVPGNIAGWAAGRGLGVRVRKPKMED